MSGLTLILASGGFAALMLFAAMQDVGSYRIPNAASLGLVALHLAAAPFVSLSWSEYGMALLSAVITLVAALALFARGWIGGGDGKLAAAMALWLGPSQTLLGLLYAGLAGGALALFLIAFRTMPLRPVLARRAWIARLHDPSEGVPYAAALACGALLAYPQSPWGMRLLGLEGNIS